MAHRSTSGLLSGPDGGWRAARTEAPFISVAEEHRRALSKQATAGGLQTILAALQILAETKTRMKGATFGRVLLELALVRIATLEQLDAVAELIAQLRQSKGGANPSPPSVARTIPAPSNSPSAPDRAARIPPEPVSKPQELAPADVSPPRPVRHDPAHTPEDPTLGMEIAESGARARVDDPVGAGIRTQTGAVAPAGPAIEIPFEAGRERISGRKHLLCCRICRERMPRMFAALQFPGQTH